MNDTSLKWLLLFGLSLISGLTFAQQEQPNIIMIVVDDMRYDEWGGGGHTFLKTPSIDRLAAEGTQFTRAYHTVPLCSPNRASILTGQYPSRHGIIDNTSRNQASYMLDLFPKYLQAAGYKTAHVGKWHMGNSPKPRPGYDYWLCMEGQGKTYDPKLYEGEQEIQYEGYITDIFTEKSVDFIKRSSGAPFFLYIGHKAVHPEAIQRDDGTTDLSVPKTFIAADRHKGTYPNEIFKRSDSYSPTGTADDGKPVIREAFKLRAKTMEEDPRWVTEIDLGVSEKSIRDRAEMMLAVDESLEKIMATLNELDLDDNTVIIFTSDNGYFFGEHGFSLERRMPYEESVKTPLIIKHPGISKPVSIVNGLTLSIDLSATALDLAHVEIPATIQGQSLIPLITGETKEIRPAAFIEYYSNENPFPWTAQLDYRVVVTEQYKYIKWLRFDEAELYDLENDPYEQHNLIHDPSYQSVVKELHNQMKHLQLEALGLE
ncbi:MAG: sulfatase-like hydrolase/transferase [Saprospiraceae bacterium]|nr:sulfatase-like hydrolase/transferase [Saprospiraceae bacterium]